MSYRLTRLGRQWYAREFDSLDDEIDVINGLISAGDHALIVADLDDAERLLDIERDDIIVVEGDDE